MAGDMTAGRGNLGHMAGDMAGAHGVLGHMAGDMAVEDDVLGHMGIMRKLVSVMVRADVGKAKSRKATLLKTMRRFSPTEVVYKKQQRASITALHKFGAQRVALQQAVSVVAKGFHSGITSCVNNCITCCFKLSASIFS